MKTFTSQIFMFLILVTWFNFFSLQSKAQSFSHPATGLVVTGDVMHAQSGSNFIGVVYSRTGNVYYNQVNPAGVWGEETLLGTGSEARLAIDSNDHPHVVFTAATSPTKIAYLKYDGSNWSEVVYIESNNGGACSKPDVAVDGNGFAHISFSDRLGNTGGQSDKDDIIYSTNQSGNFVKSIIFTGYYENWGGSAYYGEYFDKGSRICVNSNGDYFIAAHYQLYDRSSGGTAYRTYTIKMYSNLGTGSVSPTSSSDIFDVFDLKYIGNSVKLLYKQTAFKTSELTVSGTTIGFANTQDVTLASSVSSVAGNSTNLVVGGKNSTNNLFSKWNDLGHVYTDVVVKNTVVSAVEVGAVFYVVYTDNGDGKIKIREVAEPLSITRFEVPGQDGPAFIDGQAGTVDVKVASGTDLTNLIATFTTTTDVSGVTVESVAQTSGVTPNNFSAQLTYVLSDGISSRNWLVNVGTGIANTIEVAICEGETYTFGTQQCSVSGEYIETFISSTGSDSTVMLILTVNPNTASSITVNACDSYTAPDGAVYTTSGIKTAVIPNMAGCDSTITINLTVNNSYKLPLSESLIAYYPFNGNASDESGNGHDGTVNGATLTEDRNGNANSAYLFDGNDGIDIPHSDELNMSGPLSVSCWIKPTELQNAMIFGKSNYTSTTNYLLRVKSDGNIQWEYDGYLNTTTSPLQANNWYHIVVTANNPGEQRKVYVNGQLIAETTSSSGPFGNLTEKLTLGYSSLNGERFKGAIDEVRFYDIDLTGAEITSLYQESLLAEKAEICEGDSYNFGGTDYTTAGEYEHTFITIHGCDSTVTLNLTVNPVYNHTETAQICAGESYSFGGTDYTTAGEYEHTFTSIHDCDSTVTLTLTVNPVYNQTVQAGICEGESYTFGTDTLDTAGEYEKTFASINGCDSTVTLTLTVHPGYNLPAPETHVAFYPFDGDANDVSGNGLNGTVNGATLTDDRNGNTNSAYFFDGYAGQNGIDVEHSDELYMDGPFSISLWLKPEIAQNALILGKSNFTLTTNYWVRISSDGNIFWDYNGIQATTTSPLQPNNWYHIVFTANNPGGEKNIYINGQLISGTNSYPSNMNFGNVTTRLTIGYSSYYSDYFKGAIDEIRIFDKELTEREIAILFDESLLAENAEICEGESYSFGGTDYTEAGEYEHTFTSVNGCDSTVTLILTVNPVYTHTEQATICEGDFYTFGTDTLDTAGEYEKTFFSVNGCDSTVTLTLTVNPVYNHTVQASICDGGFYTFGTDTLDTAGEYEKTFSSINGCDSTVTLVLTVYPTYNNPVSDCEVLITTENVYNGNSYLLTYVHGEYGVEFSLADWNDLLAIDDIDAWIACKGLQNQDSFWILNNGQHFYDGTHHYFVQYNPGGAHGYFDFHAEIGNKLFLYSWYGLDIPILAKNNNPSVKLQVCSNELPYHFGTQSLTEPGQYTEVFQTIHGCDSTVTITLVVNPVYNHTDVASICQGESYTFGRQTLTTSGEYEEKFTSVTGCDSTVTLTLTVNPVYTHTVQASICEGESYPFGTETITTAGEYEKTFSSINGCDSTVTLVLTVYPTYNNPVSDCNVLTTTENVYSETSNLLTNVHAEYGDEFSLADWNDLLAIDDIDAWIACKGLQNQDLFWVLNNGQHYYDGTRHFFVQYYPGGAPGFFDVHAEIGNKLFLGSWYGLQIPILAKDNNPSTKVQVCSNELPYHFGTQWLTDPGQYTEVFQTIHGCDSTVTITLSVNPVYNHTDVASICQGESYSFGPQTLTTSGEYEHTFTSVTGCDSTVTLTLTVNPVYNTTESLTVYEDDLPLQFGLQSLTAAGTFTETFPTAAGCDSTVTLTLTVKPADITPPVVVCNPISVSLNSSGQYVLTDDDINEIADGTTDNDSEFEDLILAVVPDEFSCSQAGTNVPVMVVVTDLRANRDTCYTTVQVSDAILPEIICRNTSLTLDENGQATLSISDVYSSATDGCGIQSVTASKTTFYCQDLGSQIIQITATDNNNNSQSCYATVSVNDYLSPVFESVGNQVVTAADGACTVSVTYPRISAFDNCGNVDIQLFEGLGENGIFPAGTTVERWVATDGSGNSDTLRFEIQVLTNPAKPAFDTLAVVETLEDSDWFSVHLTHIYDGLDCEDSPLEFSLQPENELLFDTCQFYYVTGNDSALLRMLPAPDAFGETKAVIKVTNPETGLEYSDTLTLRITPVNDPPFVVRPLEDLQTRAGDTLKMVLVPEQGYYFDDIDDETLQLSLKMSNGENIPGWLRFRNDSILAFPAIADTGCINVILVATDLAGDEVHSPFVFCVGFPVGNQLFDSQKLKVYPNPTTGKVYIDFLKYTGEKINISVVNYLGQEVLQKMYQGEERLEIDLAGKSSGMYIIRAKGKDFDANFRIILKPLR